MRSNKIVRQVLMATVAGLALLGTASPAIADDAASGFGSDEGRNSLIVDYDARIELGGSGPGDPLHDALFSS